jgi:hypothetical protein
MRVCQMNSRPKTKINKGVLISLEKRQLDFLEKKYVEDGISHSKFIRMAIDKEIKREQISKNAEPRKEPKKKGFDFGRLRDGCRQAQKDLFS